jgi:hypothetical protein
LGVLPQKRQKRRAEEDTKKRGQNADRKGEKHEDRQPTGLRFGASTIARAKCVGLRDKEIRKGRA